MRLTGRFPRLPSAARSAAAILAGVQYLTAAAWAAVPVASLTTVPPAGRPSAWWSPAAQAALPGAGLHADGDHGHRDSCDDSVTERYPHGYPECYPPRPVIISRDAPKFSAEVLRSDT